jgi:small subunit ribosomal protein S20
MANIKSAKKRWAQSLKARQRNRAARTIARSEIRRVREAAAGGEGDSAQAALSEAYSALDRAARKGAIHRRNADRRKRRLAALVANTTSS